MNELRKLAEAATMGPWKIRRHLDIGYTVVSSRLFIIAPYIKVKGDAAFIAAANPKAILELLDRLNTAESDLKESDHALGAMTTCAGELQDSANEAVVALKDALSWAENWDSPFLEDDDWLKDMSRIKAVLGES